MLLDNDVRLGYGDHVGAGDGVVGTICLNPPYSLLKAIASWLMGQLRLQVYRMNLIWAIPFIGGWAPLMNRWGDKMT